MTMASALGGLYDVAVVGLDSVDNVDSVVTVAK